MERINVAELLKDCPQGMELDCTMYDNLYFNQIYGDDGYLYKIGCYTIVDEIRTTVNFTEFGTFNIHTNSKCVIFPKGRTTWEGFVPPRVFKDGDVVFYDNTIAIFKEWGDETLFRTYATKYLCCDFCIDVNVPLFGKGVRSEIRLATEDEKEVLFKAIKDNGYRWDSKNKILERIEPEFKDGDVVVAVTPNGVSNQLFLLKHLKCHKNNNGYAGYCYFGWNFRNNRLFKEGDWGFDRLATEEEKVKLFQAIEEHGYKWNEETKTLEKLKFKVGDKIRLKNGGSVIEVTSINNDGSICVNGMSSWTIKIKQQDNYELVNKFDINTLIPFESKVLVRNSKDQYWIPAFWGFRAKDGYVTTFGHCNYCIPFMGNEHLLDTTDDCDEYYKTWE